MSHLIHTNCDGNELPSRDMNEWKNEISFHSLDALGVSFKNATRETPNVESFRLRDGLLENAKCICNSTPWTWEIIRKMKFNWRNTCSACLAWWFNLVFGFLYIFTLSIMYLFFTIAHFSQYKYKDTHMNNI